MGQGAGEDHPVAGGRPIGGRGEVGEVDFAALVVVIEVNGQGEAAMRGLGRGVVAMRDEVAPSLGRVATDVEVFEAGDLGGKGGRHRRPGPAAEQPPHLVPERAGEPMIAAVLDRGVDARRVAPVLHQHHGSLDRAAGVGFDEALAERAIEQPGQLEHGRVGVR